jgi:hypothetical protein
MTIDLYPDHPTDGRLCFPDTCGGSATFPCHTTTRRHMTPEGPVMEEDPMEAFEREFEPEPTPEVKKDTGGKVAYAMGYALGVILVSAAAFAVLAGSYWLGLKVFG